MLTWALSVRSFYGRTLRLITRPSVVTHCFMFVTFPAEAEDMCIDPVSATPVTRVLTYSANTSDCTFTQVVITMSQPLVPSARVVAYVY